MSGGIQDEVRLLNNLANWLYFSSTERKFFCYQKWCWY